MLNNQRLNKYHASALMLLILMTGCGGGGSDSSPIAPPVEPPVTPPVTPEPPLDHSGLTPLTAVLVDAKEHLPGGDTTVFIHSEDAFSQRPQAISDDFKLDGHFTSGDHLFRTPDTDIGPLLNNGTCQGCHLNDGRGIVPLSSTDPMLSMLVKIGNGNGLSDPMYGNQIQPFAVQSFTTSDFSSGLPIYEGSVNGTELYGEAFPFITYEALTGSYPDGTNYELRKPVYRIKDLSFGAFMEDIRFSPRVAPQAFGVGLLAEIPQENILALADQDDSNGDGISGRPSMVVDFVSNETVLGRFAYKAQNPTVLQQVAGAYNGDIGVTTSLKPDEPCTVNQEACILVAEQEQKTGSDADLSDKELALVEFYNRVLGVPSRRGYSEDTESFSENVLAGRKLFFDANCVGCHTPRHITHEAPGSVLGEITLVGLEDNPEPIAVLSEQTIFPYTDLLLHDMGGSCSVTRETIDGQTCESGLECHYVQRCEGLADGLPQGDASGSEWKTPALWGIGLVQTVNQKATFLHDGRARTIEEAILWHGGEAQNSLDNFKNLTSAERLQLIEFVESL